MWVLHMTPAPHPCQRRKRGTQHRRTHAIRNNDVPRILERGVDDPLDLDENPRRWRASAVLRAITWHGSGVRRVQG